MENRLKSLLSVPSIITITNNTRSMLSFKRREQAFHVRLHRIFLNADEPVIKAVAEYVKGRSKRPLEIIRDFIREHTSSISRPKPVAPRRVCIRHQGRHFNLLESYQKINNTYFNGELVCAITWGKTSERPRRRSVRLGSYSPASDIIRINPVLDKDYVPQYVLDSITYHEMLHKFLGFRYTNGRRSAHPPAFKEMEKRFTHADPAKAWIKKNLNLLMCRM
jgi:hypothetical protein